MPQHAYDLDAGSKEITKASLLHSVRPGASANPVLDVSRDSIDSIRCHLRLRSQHSDDTSDLIYDSSSHGSLSMGDGGSLLLVLV